MYSGSKLHWICPPDASGECRTTFQSSNGTLVIEINSANIPEYTHKLEINSDFSIKKIVKSEENKFVDEVVNVALPFLQRNCKQVSLSMHCTLHLNLSNCFYGNRNEQSKTGLGSSAVVTVLLTFSILKCFAFEFNNEMLFALSYRAHAMAQGKIGSGFDVAACIFGSHFFQRIKFSDSIFANDFIDNFYHSYQSLLPRIERLQLVQSLEISLISVGFGSKTPGLVKRVSVWGAVFPEKRVELFGQIDSCTRDLYKALLRVDLHLCKSLGKVLDVVCYYL